MTQHFTSPPTDPTAPIAALETRLWETLGDLWDNAVDPAEPLYDVDGSPWSPLGNPAESAGAAGMAFTTELQLRDIRTQCRALAVSNEFAINGHDCHLTYTTFRCSRHFRGKTAGKGGFGPGRTL